MSNHQWRQSSDSLSRIVDWWSAHSKVRPVYLQRNSLGHRRGTISRKIREIHWIPAYCGRNERADIAAKEATGWRIKRKRNNRNEEVDTNNTCPPANLARISTAQRQNVTDSMSLKWAKSWGVAEKGKDFRRIMPSPLKQVLNLHRGIKKAHSTLIVQMHTAKIGLRHFLHTSKVPGITDGKCECRREKQIVRHVATQCCKHSQLRRETWRTLEKREPFGTIEWTKMLNHLLCAQKAAIFMKNTRLLSQSEHVALIPLQYPHPSEARNRIL